ncbi:MAG: hypothetical protein ABSD98_00455 [Candidatus Korobacteraceae bacterium]|jgi:hypothetical protein
MSKEVAGMVIVTAGIQLATLGRLGRVDLVARLTAAENSCKVRVLEAVPAF